jgi:hypothetical protein
MAIQVDLILRPSTLEVLEWNHDNYWTDQEQTLFNQPLQNKHWPHLSNLSIGYPLHDGDLACIMKSAGSDLGGMTKLRLVGCKFGTQTHKALELHLSNIVSLDLSWCLALTSPVTRDLLCCCPNLEVLLARSVYAEDIAEGGPWLCQQIRRLVICIRFEDLKPDLHQLVFERLSTLDQLEHLDLDITYNDDDNDDCVLLFRLDWGMEQLATLQQLKSFSFDTDTVDRYTPQLGMDEVVWMMEHWKKLKRVNGPFNRDPRIAAQIRSAFESHGITTC